MQDPLAPINAMFDKMFRTEEQPTIPLDTALNAFLAHMGIELEPHERWRYLEGMRLAVKAYVEAEKAGEE